jgi:hypothetical protein
VQSFEVIFETVGADFSSCFVVMRMLLHGCFL